MNQSKKVGSIVAVSIVYALLSIIAGILFAYADIKVSLIYFIVIIAGLIGVGVAEVLKLLYKKLVIADKKVGMTIGIIGMFIFLYSACVSWIFIYSEHEALIFNPIDIVSIFKILLNEGIWELSRISSSIEMGPFLTLLFWAIEVAAYATCIISGIGKFYNKNLYCSDCEEWLDDIKTVYVMNDITKDQIKNVFESSMANYVEELKPIEDIYDKFYSIIFSKCNYCGESVVTINECSITKQRNKKPSVRTKNVASNIKVTEEVYEKLCNLCGPIANYQEA